MSREPDAELGGDPACWAHLYADPADTADTADESRPPIVADLGAIDTTGAAGAVWSLPHDGDLDANLVRLGPGGAIAEHVNEEVDVLVFVQAGSGRLRIDGDEQPLRVDVLARIPRAVSRRISAGTDGLTYLSVHRRRGPLTIGDGRARPT